MLLARILNSTFSWGELDIIDANGGRHRFSGESGHKSTIRLHDPRLHVRLALSPDIAFGEAYMDGPLTIEECDLSDFLNIAVQNMYALDRHWGQRLTKSIIQSVARLIQKNTLRRSRENVSHHYDLSKELFESFLDSDRQYSCAYFLDPGEDLESAQENKRRIIAAKLLLEHGQHVLDIGSGWGGLSIALAQSADVEVTRITLSEEQHKVSVDRAMRAGVADRVRFVLKDYRDVTGEFDRIVSVGMFEHVGLSHYPEFFNKCREILAEDGVALLHTIGRPLGAVETNAWIRKYIFPGGYTPPLSQSTAALEQSGLFITDIEIWRIHYAETLKKWRQRFNQNHGSLPQSYDDRFARMWNFYLAGFEAAFRQGYLAVHQIQFARRQDAVPLTCDYLADWHSYADSELYTPPHNWRQTG